ncbi:MAG TPA: hypothetical protein VHA14_04935 [Bryobacteraceae bacterium]|nr:hypothetical protein [Bryobacteraceae bacterium]
MLRTFAAALLAIGLGACNKVPTVQAQSTDQQSSFDNLPPAAPDDAVQTPESQVAYGDQAPPDDDSQAIETTQPPPPLPEYDQPYAPGPDYYWTPGYWAWGPGGYYWVPGEWVEAPWIGAVWTPPYWAFDNGYYLFHAGYWGPHVGFYGGIDYGFGYPGRGYYGAYWNGGHLYYNRAVTHVNTNVIHDYYRRDVPRYQSSRTSYNGGHGGINFRPIPQERVVTHERRAPAQAAQMQVAQQAREQHNRTNFVAPAQQPNRMQNNMQNRFNGRPAPQVLQPTPQEPRQRQFERPAPQTHDFHPAPHPAPATPAQPQRRPDLQNHLELQRQRPAPQPQQAPIQRQAPQRRPDLQNHLELQRQRPAPQAAPHVNAPQPQPQAHPAPAARGNGNAGERRNGGEHGRGREQR